VSLLPCPFCGASGDERLIDLWDRFDAGHIANVHCTSCGGDGPSVYCEDGASFAIDGARGQWNQRFFGGSCQVIPSDKRAIASRENEAPIDNDPASQNEQRQKPR
jgi:hypothetical protein